MDTNNSRECDRRISIVRQIIYLSRQHFQLCTAHLEETGVGGGQVPVLMELERFGELNQRELAQKTRVTPATMSGTLKRMERAGLIVRTTDENDARVSKVRLTEAGYAQCDRAHKGFDLACQQILAALDEESLSALGELLTRIQDSLPPASSCRKTPPSTAQEADSDPEESEVPPTDQYKKE